MRRRGTAPALALVAALGGCTVGPDYHARELPTPAKYAEGTNIAPDARTVDLARWWQAFGDPELETLVTRALAQNVDVKAAISRVREARLGIVQARAAGLPELDLQGNAQRQYLHERVEPGEGAQELLDGLGTGGDAATIPDSVPIRGHSDTFGGGLSASWELDVFGGARRGVEAARARADAASWSVRDAQVMLAGQVAAAYLQYRQLQRQEGVANYEAARQQRALDTQNNIYKVGLTPQSTSVQQSAQLAATRATVEPLQAEQRVQVHALGVLLAQPPETLIAELATVRRDPPPPPALPPGLPSELLRRRPDIRVAERELAAATADIGVAVADLYPRFELTGLFQWMSMGIGNLLTISGRTASGAGAVSFPVLDWGRRKAVVGQRREAAEQAYLRYQRTVLVALQDVENALARIDAEQRRNRQLREGLKDAERAVTFARERFETGLADYVSVLDAQRGVLQAEDQIAQSDGALRRGIAQLYQALGGGWDERAPDPAAAPGPGA